MGLFYRNVTPPVNLDEVLSAAREAENDPKAYHNSVKHRPDAWGFNIASCDRDGFSVTVFLRLTWNVDRSTRPTYTRLKHIRRILDTFGHSLSIRRMKATYDPMEISISVEGNTLAVEQSLRVYRELAFEEANTTEGEVT